MKISLGADHAGYKCKEKIIDYLLKRGIEVIDRGTNGLKSVDYPDYIHLVANDVEQCRADLGIVSCGSGNGAAMTANKHPLVRAALAWTPELAILARAHNDSNVLSIPARFVSEDGWLDIVAAYLDARFQGGRHQRRVAKIPLG